MKHLGFGLDLAGYTTGKSALACASFDGERLYITILVDCPFSMKREMLSNRLVAETSDRATLRELLKSGPLTIDAPIDLQGLPFGHASTALWGQCKRAIDYHLKALPPFADKLGAVVSRLHYALDPEIVSEFLGNGLYETYPAASLSVMGQQSRSYKGTAGAAGLNELRRWLGIDLDVTDDEFDAIICAITSVADDEMLLQEAGLAAHLKQAISSVELPKGYRLLNARPTVPIFAQRIRYEVWRETQVPIR